MEGNKKLVILYGSQTGTAQELAETIWRQSRIRGFSGPVQAMDDYNIEGLVRERFVIFVCSTTGLGEEPDNMKKSWKFLLRKSLPSNSLHNLSFGVLGLGDSSYSKYNYPAKKINKRLLQLGAKHLLEIGLCDYQHDLGNDAVSDPWIANLWSSLIQYFPDQNMISTNIASISRWKIKYEKISDSDLKVHSSDLYFSDCKSLEESIEKPVLMKVKANKRTTSENHFQDVRLLEFSPEIWCFNSYQPGDVLNLRPKNLKINIDKFFEIFKDHKLALSPDDVVNVVQIDDGEFFLDEIKNNLLPG